jgi:branched-chain amino acid transport system substrate-binding protein
MTVSPKVLAVVAVLVLVCGFTAGWFARVPVPAQPEEREFVIGALLPLTGDLAFAGNAGAAGLELAIEDVNTYLAASNSELRVRVIIEDTETSPDVAHERLQELAARGVAIVLGPESSAEVDAVQAYAADKGIVLLSQGSTAPSLAIPNDNLLRFRPDDTHQAEAIAQLLWNDGVKLLIPVWRGDVWGDDLADATKRSFEALGGMTVAGVRYNPEATQFSAELEQVNGLVSDALAQYGDTDAVAIQLMAFDEVVPLFSEAASYPLLASVRWYGGDGTALDANLLTTPEAARFALDTGFSNPFYAPPETEKYERLEQRVREQIDSSLTAYAATFYDAVWVATLAHLATDGTEDAATLNQALHETADLYFGATGWTTLNEAGDRAFGDYDFWAIETVNGSYEWVRVARYEVSPGLPGTIQYEQPPWPTPSRRVLVIHSYDEGWSWDQDVQRGIVEGLSRHGYSRDRDYELKTFYMDTKVTYTTPEQIEERAKMAIALIEEFEPDIVFVNDDNALKYVAVAYTDRYPDRGLPFVFSGVNVDPTIYAPITSLEHPDGPITGALERFPYYEGFTLAKRIVPNASTIVLLADSSSSSSFVVSTFKERYLDVVNDSPLQVLGPIQVETFREWQETVTAYQTEADLLGILTYHQLRDENGTVVPAPVVVEWTVQHNNLPELGVLTFHADDGYFAAVGVSGYKTGLYVGVLSGEILGGTDPANIPIVDPAVIEVAFNLGRADALGITLPAEELVKANEVFHARG